MSRYRISTLLVLASMAFTSATFLDLELSTVQVLFRHGDRAPVKEMKYAYPGDPYYFDDYQSYGGYGALIKKGSKRAFVLGNYVRQRYFDELGITENSTDLIKVNSSSVERSFKSTQAFLNGLTPLSSQIPIFQHESSKDVIFLSTSNCPRLLFEETFEMVHLMAHESTKDWSELQSYTSEHLGYNTTLLNIYAMFDTLRAQESLGYPLPEWLLGIYHSGEMEKVAADFFASLSRTFYETQLVGGVWLYEFLRNIDATTAQGTDNGKKLFVYGGHDINVAGILSAFDAYDYQVPMFCSGIIVELYHDRARPGSYYIRVLHEDDMHVREIPIPHCRSPCPVDDFRLIMDPLIPKDIEKECGLPRNATTGENWI